MSDMDVHIYQVTKFPNDNHSPSQSMLDYSNTSWINHRTPEKPVVFLVWTWIYLLNYYFIKICGVVFLNNGHIAAVYLKRSSL